MVRTAFVTGGTGFVGSHLVEELLSREYGEVRCLVRSNPKWLDGLDVTLVRGTLDDGAVLREAVAGCDVVYHVAGRTRAPRSEALYRANVDGTRALLEAVRDAAPGVEKVLLTSSLAAVGPSVDGPLDEDAPMRPLTHYGRSKAAMEHLAAGEFSDLPWTVVRPPAVYGPREADIFTVIKTADRRLFPIVGHGREPQLALVHVRDLVRGMVAAAESPASTHRAYFLTGARDYSWHEVRETILGALGHGAVKLDVPAPLVALVGAAAEGWGRLTGQHPPLNREKAREAQRAWRASSARAAADFGYRPEVGLEEGMREAVAWYRAHGWLRPDPGAPAASGDVSPEAG